MGRYCGVCGKRLDDATGSCGPFPTNKGFAGWLFSEVYQRSVIESACQECAGMLREAVTKKANEIVAANEDRVQGLREELRCNREQAERLRKEKIEFERAWDTRKQEEP